MIKIVLLTSDNKAISFVVFLLDPCFDVMYFKSDFSTKQQTFNTVSL